MRWGGVSRCSYGPAINANAKRDQTLSRQNVLNVQLHGEVGPWFQLKWGNQLIKHSCRGFRLGLGLFLWQWHPNLLSWLFKWQVVDAKVVPPCVSGVISWPWGDQTRVAIKINTWKHTCADHWGTCTKCHKGPQCPFSVSLGQRCFTDYVENTVMRK